jgi:orotidine-5'-phosphate decarboxylase
MLCVGLDVDIQRLPIHLTKDINGVRIFLHEIIESTKDYCIAYKPNTAFFESMGTGGWDLLYELSEFIGKDYFKIADAKRGDIGNTAKAYAKTFFEDMGYDAITVSPYMGFDTLDPFLSYTDKWTIALGLTSNPGFKDIQMLKLENGQNVYEIVIGRMAQQFNSDQLMFVVGATRSEYITRIRELAPDHFFLMPGIGAQGGDLNQAVNAGLNSTYGMLINASRSIVYASNEVDFAQKAAHEAKKIANQMAQLI